jgi:hypothetical protein
VLIAAAVCPHPPLLVPAAAGGAAAELDDVRTACDAAVSVLAKARPDLFVAVGGAAEAAEFDGSAAGSLTAYGVGWRTGDGTPVLPLSLTIGRWLLERAGLLGADRGEQAAIAGSRARERPAATRAVPGAGAVGLVSRVRLCATPFGAPTAACLRLGAEIAGRAARVALLAMGDGPACISPQAPGYFDPRAERFDAELAGALADADVARLARLDPELSAELLTAGRAAWQVLAGAARDGRYRGRLLSAAAPYGVSYLVASWTAITCP